MSSSSSPSCLASDSSLDQDSDTDTVGSSDLDDLYESFDFEEEAALETTPARLSNISQCALYPGAQISALQSYLLLFRFSVRHSLTTKSFTELLQLVSVHLPASAKIPTSVYKMKQVFLECFPDSQATRHFYCDCCHRPLPSASSRCSGYGCSGDGCPAAF